MPHTAVGLIGVGRWGRHLARNFTHLGVLRALCDHHLDALLPYQEDGLLSCYRHHEDLLDDPSVAAVAIATRADSHYDLARSALLAGKDVYVEKPLCLRLQEAQQLHQLAQSEGRILMVGHLLRYHPAIEELQRVISEGEIGELQYLAANRLNLGVFGMEGSALWDLAPHDISVILALCADRLPNEVRCVGAAYLNPQVPDLSVSTLSFDQGVQAHLFVSWLNPFKEHKLTVLGERGMAVFDDTQPWENKLVIYREPIQWNGEGTPSPSGCEPEALSLTPTEPLGCECAHFIQCCEARTTPRTDGAEAIRVLTVLEALHHSLEAQGKCSLIGPVP